MPLEKAQTGVSEKTKRTTTWPIVLLALFYSSCIVYGWQLHTVRDIHFRSLKVVIMVLLAAGLFYLAISHFFKWIDARQPVSRGGGVLSSRPFV